MNNKNTSVNASIALLIVGYKGYQTLKSIPLDLNISFVASYKDSYTLDESNEEIIRYCNENNLNYYDKSSLSNNLLTLPDIVFCIGWQYKIEEPLKNLIVLHDSLLPRYRGFSPTVNALINNETEIGVSAFLPNEYIDSGALYGKSQLTIKHPIKIKKVFDLLADNYLTLINELISQFENNSLTTIEQNEEEATYSIWRDSSDYLINWHWDANKICRFVDALGWPFHGAQSNYNNQSIVIHDVKTVKDISFELRHPGKIWQIKDDSPIVICGSGMLQIELATYVNSEEPIQFKKLKMRLT